MNKAVKLWFLRAAKCLGLFALARRLTERDLRILCYHGVALRDEDRFRPSLFMSGATFAARMQCLADLHYPVIPLDEALERLKGRTLPRNATAVTIDDGWIGTYRIMAPILHRHGFPATLYVASYYVEKQTQVFNVAVSYVLWKAGNRVLDLSLVTSELEGVYALAVAEQRENVYKVLSDFGESLASAVKRQSLLRKLCEALVVDWRQIEADRLMCFVHEEEAREMSSMDIDVQLHTHRHRFPESFERVKTEIDDNRRALARISSHPLRHFCYPSGNYRRAQQPWLEKLGIRSAVTTKRGFNRHAQSVFELRRFLDSERVSQLEFEAELSGFFELIRRCGYSI